MKSVLNNVFSNKFKIPTVLGLGIIILGIAAGVILTLREQNFISKASPDETPQNITIANISENEVNISWQTSQPVSSFITYGLKTVSEQTILDDRDTKIPMTHSIHFFTIKNLLPKTEYQYKIFSSKFQSEINKFETAAPLNTQTGFRPIIGTVIDKDKPLNEGIAYLSIAGASIQAALVKNSGNFLIPISQIRKSDLSENLLLTEDTLAKLTIISGNGQATVSFKLKSSEQELPSIHLGENSDLTNPPSEDLNKYDLNGDGKINAADNAIILQTFGKKGQNMPGDLNKDGVVDRKDLDLMSKQINK